MTLRSTGIVFDIKKFSIHDGPGIRTTVFFKGCPLRCRWCHNPEGIRRRPEPIFWPNRCLHCQTCLDECGQQAIYWNDDGYPHTNRELCIACGDCVETCYADARQIAGQEMSVDQVMAEIEKDRPFFEQSGGGVTISGGEPLLQVDFLDSLLFACQSAGLHTALDTSGYAAWPDIDRIRDKVDLFLYDVKLPDNEKHRAYTGVPNDIILTNLRKLDELCHALSLRIPLIPGINDDDEAIRGFGELAASLANLTDVCILPYHPLARDKYVRQEEEYRLNDTAKPTAERLQEIVDRIAYSVSKSNIKARRVSNSACQKAPFSIKIGG